MNEPTMERWAAAHQLTVQYQMVEKAKLGLSSHRKAFERVGVPIPDLMDGWHEAQDIELSRVLSWLEKQITACWKGSGVGAFVAETHGLGPALLRVLSRLPRPLSEFGNPAKLWKYCGLAPGITQGYSGVARAWMIARVADPIIRVGGPYRNLYDERKASKVEMLEEGVGCEFCDAAYAKRRATRKQGWDCHNLGGPHWKKGHIDADAKRYIAKRILRDVWKVAHGSMAKALVEPNCGLPETVTP